MTPIAPLELEGDARLVVMTGAGVSAESGIPTFRDANGLWEQHRFEDVASPEKLGKKVLFAESSRSEMRNHVEHFALGAEKKVGFWPTF